MRRAFAACPLLLLAVLGGCGTETGTGPKPSSEGEWRGETLSADPGADSPTGFTADGEDVLVVVLSEDGTLQSHLSTDGAEFVAGEPVGTGAGGYPGFADPVRMNGTWWVVGSGGLGEVDGDEEILFEPQVMRSDDGLRWEAVDVSGLEGPVELNAVASLDGALVAVGTHRNAENPSGPGSAAGVWRSEDGADWTEGVLPGVVPDPSYKEESWAASLAVVDGRLLAGGQASGRGAVWSSDDAGATWEQVPAPELNELSTVSGLAADGSTVVVSGTPKGEDSGSQVLRSGDGGRTWTVPSTPPPAEGEGWAPVWSGGGRFFTMSEPSFDVWSEPEVCYADLDQCRDAASSEEWALYASDDGDSWRPVDISGIDAGDEVAAVTGTASGRVLTLHHVRDGVAVHTWPAGVELPAGSALAEPERVELATVPEGEDPEPGVRYHAPLYIHCGMDWLYLGDRPWQRTDGGPDVETGAGDDVPQDWPIAGQTIYGYATLTDAGVVEYTTESGEIIATYERTGEEPPGCD